MPRRPKKSLKRREENTLSQEDLQFLLWGNVLLSGSEHSFKTDSEAKKAYQKNKKFLFSFIGQYKDVVEDNSHDFDYRMHWGQRPWSFYRFGFKENFEHLYYRFQNAWHSGKRDQELEFLRGEDLLIADEDTEFERQEKRHAQYIEERKAALLTAKKQKKILEFPKKR
jgi:hypothetical protein